MTHVLLNDLAGSKQVPDSLSFQLRLQLSSLIFTVRLVS